MESRVSLWWIVGAVAVMAAAVGATRWMIRAKPPTTLERAGFAFPLMAETAAPGVVTGDIRMRLPDGPPRIATGALDALGRPVTVSCASCHSNLPPNPLRVAIDDQMQFHTDMRYAHGTLSCLSCHNSSDYNLLRLADGRDLEYRNVRMLCSQCHMPQARDWERGAHGGMSGYWDLSRGPRFRKICIDCHDPHAPQFPAMRPTFKPHDRFLNPHAHHDEGGGDR